jgi:hypothetical protein
VGTLGEAIGGVEERVRQGDGGFHTFSITRG